MDCNICGEPLSTKPLCIHWIVIIVVIMNVFKTFIMFRKNVNAPYVDNIVKDCIL